MTCPYCTDDFPFSVKVAVIETKCKYHPREGMRYPFETLAPAGMCRELFFAAYPECLAALYHGKPRPWRTREPGAARESFARCPAPGGVRVRILAREKLPAPLRQAKELTEEACKSLIRPVDAHFRGVSLEVAEAGPVCHKGYAVGQRFEFNVSDTRQLCPAGFATVYPFARQQRARLARGEAPAPEPMRVHCPDFVGVTYEVLPPEPGAAAPGES